ncbi:hypothetical protein HID58_025577 [Brassica napus]|uniref:Protein kinase domain-containing protein n=1 Tax=Brassica napus TaxID=3708 RepID=A0ABQ7X521_BRANA|nr:hypothetical protein HID58_091308 [Brassica napus]KAH0917917.1 hypothetical protein HID58_025577 [Brassica napus]
MNELKEGHCREKGSIQNFRFADAPVSIRFVEQTSFVDISASNNPSPTKSFRDGPACISVFGNLAELIDEELVMSGVEPKVVVATNINPKLVGELVTTRLVSVGSVPEIKEQTTKESFLLHGISPESIFFGPYCNEESKMNVVYEYMKKGMLKDHLYDSDNPRLSWRQKLEICAKGLHYLHTGSARAIIHCAIEALDPNYELVVY